MPSKLYTVKKKNGKDSKKVTVARKELVAPKKATPKRANLKKALGGKIKSFKSKHAAGMSKLDKTKRKGVKPTLGKFDSKKVDVEGKEWKEATYKGKVFKTKDAAAQARLKRKKK
jgi:hypothetical protein